MAFPRLCPALALAVVLALCLAGPVSANYCPRFPCPTNRTDRLDFLSTHRNLTSVIMPSITSLNAANVSICKASCPCNAKYFALRQFGGQRGAPLSYQCVCYDACINGTFTGATGRGSPGIVHGYICESVCDDPHFVGAHGTRYDFNGEIDKNFCLITDKSVHVNAFFKGYTTDTTVGATVQADGKALRTWMSALGIVWMDAANQKHSLSLVAAKHADLSRGEGFLEAVVLDNAVVAVPQAAGSLVQVADVSLTFAGTFKNSWGAVEDKFILSVGDKLEMMLHVGPARPVFHLPGDSMVHISFSVNKINPTDAIHGVLGQTFRNTREQILRAERFTALDQLLHESIKADGDSGKGFLDGGVKDYISSDITAVDCAMSAFQ